MSSIEEIRRERLNKVKALRESGIDPYPITTKRSHTAQEAIDGFDSLSSQTITIVGRVRAIRGHGGLTFIKIEDGSGSIQLFLEKEKMREKEYLFFLEKIDVGDFLQAEGTLFLTKRGEKTLEVKKLRILSKSILPLPEKWHGLKDEEERYRKRYLDVIFNPEVKEMIKKRALFWGTIRNFLIERDFLEVETPILENKAGGADAEPFKTYHNALGIELYLRISMGELWQKKLLVAGFEKTFEIGRQFRNEGISPEHLQDYTQMEFYWAYADHREGMELVEELYKEIAIKTFGTTRFKIKGFDVDIASDWKRYDYRDTILDKTGVDIISATLEEIEERLVTLGIRYDKEGLNRGRAIDLLWKDCRKEIGGPGFLVNPPIEVSPLAKRDDANPNLAARFQVIIAGSEVGNGYSELNDPIDQAERFVEQQKLRDAGDREAQMFDHDFVEALEYGMPPACGFGLSERLFSFLMDKTVRECQIFPLMKPKNN